MSGDEEGVRPKKKDRKIQTRVPSEWVEKGEERARREGTDLLTILKRMLFGYSQGEFPPEGYKLPPTPEEGKKGRAPGGGRKKKK